jgi:hypothetical protein
MRVDIFPNLGAPAIYVAQPYGGMDPQQMEGFLNYYYEYHFLYVTGIEHIESKNIQGVSLMKLVFHPGTDMSQAMGEVVNYANRARSFMPGSVPPFIMRYDVGGVPVGQLIFSSPSRSVGEMQDIALNRVRPLFAVLEGVSAPPPFGGNQRTIVVRLDPDKLVDPYLILRIDVATGAQILWKDLFDWHRNPRSGQKRGEISPNYNLARRLICLANFSISSALFTKVKERTVVVSVLSTSAFRCTANWYNVSTSFFIAFRFCSARAALVDASGSRGFLPSTARGRRIVDQSAS